jgi:hypothetical protein
VTGGVGPWPWLRVCVAGWLVGWSVLVSAFVCAFVSAFVCSFRGLFACVLSWVEILSASASATADSRPALPRTGDTVPAPVAIVRVHIIGSVLLTLGLPDYRALADVCLSQLTS